MVRLVDDFLLLTPSAAAATAVLRRALQGGTCTSHVSGAGAADLPARALKAHAAECSVSSAGFEVEGLTVNPAKTKVH